MSASGTKRTIQLHRRLFAIGVTADMPNGSSERANLKPENLRRLFRFALAVQRVTGKKGAPLGANAALNKEPRTMPGL